MVISQGQARQSRSQVADVWKLDHGIPAVGMAVAPLKCNPFVGLRSSIGRTPRVDQLIQLKPWWSLLLEMENPKASWEFIPPAIAGYSIRLLADLLCHRLFTAGVPSE